jgi:hypothetical protein
MDIALNNRFHDVCMVIANSDKYEWIYIIFEIFYSTDVSTIFL